MKVKNIDDLCIEGYKTYKRKGIEYINLSASFDIEVSSFYKGIDKYACMYLFGIGVNGRCILGRSYDDLKKYIKKLVSYYCLDNSRRLVIYVHNLSYEFQFIRKHFKISNVFSIDERKPIYAVLECGIEFRCSYLLSGYKLEKVGEHLHTYKVNKLDGELYDYNKLRLNNTPLSDYELNYIYNDNFVVMAYIEELIEELGSIVKIPPTKTSFVRRLLKDKCLYNGDTSHRRNNYYYLEYREIMKDLTISSVSEYKALKRAFMGGYTHASSTKVMNIYHDVSSYDFTSSYPFVLCSEEYPMSRGEIVHPKNKEEFEKYLKCYCSIFDITFYDLEDKFHFEHYLSSSKCDIIGDYYNDNGRVVYAEKLTTTITNVDFEIIRKCYKWKKMEVKNFRIYEKGYLPKSIILSILELYSAKTTLKGVEDKEIEYQRSKENVNSIYGCMATDIARPDINYIDDWMDIHLLNDNEIKDKLEEYNKSKNRVLFYPWGVFCTAYARYNLWSGIFEYKEDYIYSDTDSIKGLNHKKHELYHKKYNEVAISKLKDMCDYYKIDYSLCIPKTIKGIEKPLGVWDFEGIYSRFKTLGAKRYMTEEDGNISFTISGLNKHTGVPYLCEGWNYDLKKNEYNNPFDKFTDKMYIPPEYTGKLTHTYIDEEFEIDATDYLGNVCTVHEKSYIHLSKQDFNLSIAYSFLEYLESFRIDLLLD